MIKIVHLVMLCCPFLVLGQTNSIYSIRAKIEQAKTDEEKIVNIAALADQPISGDSLLPYLQMGEHIAEANGNKHFIDQMAYVRAWYYASKNITDSASRILDRLLAKNSGKSNVKPFYLKVLFLKAKILDRSNQYAKAIVQLMEVIEVAEDLNDTLIQIQAKTGIGWIQMELEEYREALGWFYKAQQTTENKDFYRNYGALYSNMASALNELGQTDSALHYITVAVKDARENENLSFLATALSMQAKIFVDAGMGHLAESPLKEAIEIRNQLKDPYYIVYDMSSLASFYAVNGHPDMGIDLCKKGIAIAKENGYTSQLMMIYKALAANYKAAGMQEDYAKTLEDIISIKDTFSNINSGKLLTDLQAAADEKRNANTIAAQKIELTRKNYLMYASILFTVMASLTGWLAFRYYQRKQALIMSLKLKEQWLVTQQSVKDAEEQERKRIAADLHDNLGAYAASMASNLNYISFPDADERTTDALKELNRNSQAIIRQLNDTIWAFKKDALLLTSISDRLKNFISQLRRSYPEIKIELEEHITEDKKFPSSQAFHIYRMVQEAINNALKHSKGTVILVKITADTGWKATIEDNGIGMGAQLTSTSGGFGMEGMVSRSLEAGLGITWNVAEGGGTRVVICPTTN